MDAKGCLLGIVGGAVALVIGVVMSAAVVSGSAAACGDSSPGTAQQPSASAAAKNSIPSNYLQLYQKAGRDYGIDWTILAAVGSMESEHGRSNLPGVHSGENSAGAAGPMQFLQSTWDIYGVDGDGDGKKDRYDPADAIPGAANYLKALGVAKDPHTALYHYNGQGPAAVQYADEGLQIAKRYAAGNFNIGAANNAGTAANCPAVGGGKFSGQLPPGTPQMVRIAIAFAESKLGTWYLWGGTGPRYDCSGLTQAAWQAAGIKDIPRDTFHQWPWTHHIPDGQERPGDLVFFEPTPDGPGHVGMVVDAASHTMIEAPHTGAQVRYSSYLRPDRVGFGRPYNG